MSSHEPFLTIVTRCCRRPRMLTLCIQSVLAQNDHDIDHIFIVDKNTRGLIWANKQFHASRHRVDGQYVYMLDDDEVLVVPTFLTRLRQVAKMQNAPDVILTRSLILPRSGRRVYVKSPPAKVWNVDWEHGKRPKDYAGSANFAVRADVWKRHTAAYFEGMGSRWRTGGDWHFMMSLINANARFVRLDMFTSYSLQRGLGTRFSKQCPSDWWTRIVERFGITEVEPNDWRLQLYKTDGGPRGPYLEYDAWLKNPKPWSVPKASGGPRSRPRRRKRRRR